MKKVINIDIGNGTKMSFPAIESDESYSFSHYLRHAYFWDSNVKISQNTLLAIASCLDSYSYLVLHCSKEEIWKRIKLIREATL